MPAERIASLPSEQLALVVQAARRFKLDLDDAYQYAVAARHDLQIICSRR